MVQLNRSESLNTLCSSPRPDTPIVSTRRIWLDVLSIEVCTRIASYLCGAKHSRSPLYLAEVSSTQASAVLSALSYKLEIPVTPRDLSVLLSRWTAVAAPVLVEFHLTGYSAATSSYYIDGSTKEAVIRLFATAPNLRKVTIHDEFVFLNPPRRSPNGDGFQEQTDEEISVLSPLASIPNFEELTIWIRKESHFSRWTSGLVSKNMRLSITKLTCVRYDLRCHECPLSGSEIFEQLECAILRSSPSLVDLEFVESFSSCGEPLSTINFLKRNPKIRAITVYDELTPSTIAALLDMDSIRINHSKSRLRNHKQFQYEEMLALGSTVTSLRAPLNVDARQLTKLACCTRMKVLDISLSGGTELALAGVVRCMPALRVLRICTISVRSEHGDCVMHTAAKGAFLKAVKAAPPLTVLSVTDVRMEWLELEEMLKVSGGRLEEFGTTVTGQEDNPLERLESLLYAMAKHTRNVRELHDAWNTRVLEGWSGNYDGQRLIQKLRLAKKRLQQAVPFFNSSWLDRLFRETEGDDDPISHGEFALE